MNSSSIPWATLSTLTSWWRRRRLDAAVRGGNVNELRRLLSRYGAQELTLLRPSPLATATLLRHHAMMAALLQEGWPANETNEHDHTPLELACINGDVVAVAVLVEAGAHTGGRIRDKQRVGPLSYASISGNLEVVRFLVETAGVDPNDLNDETASLWRIDGEVLRYLKSKGAVFPPDIERMLREGYAAGDRTPKLP